MMMLRCHHLNLGGMRCCVDIPPAEPSPANEEASQNSRVHTGRVSEVMMQSFPAAAAVPIRSEWASVG